MLNRKKFIFGLIALCFVIIAVNPLWAQIYTPHISGVQVSYDTLYGNFGVGHFDFRRLTYAYSPPVVPWSEGASETHFVINIDGVYFTNHEYYYSECPSAVNLNPYITDHRIDYFIPEIVTTWDISVAGAPFTIRQILTPTWFDELGQVRIAYNITNSDAFSHSVGMKLFIDVKIVRRDDPPMQVGIAVIDTGSLWTYPYIPWYYQGYELSPTQPAENLSCRGYLRYGDCTTPDHFSIGQAYGLSTLCWDFDANFDFYGRMGSSYDDVGVLMRWDVTNLVAGASREYVTYYGLGGPVEIIPGLNLNATDELEYVPSACSVPTCLEVSGTAINNDIYLRDYTDVFVSIRLSDNVHYELRNDPPYSSDTLRLTSPAFLRPNEAGGFAWLICLTDTTYCTPRDPDTIFWESYVTVPAGVDTAYDTTLIYVECFDRTAPSAEIISPEGHVSCTVDEDSLVRVVLRDVDGVAHNFTRMRMWNADTSIIIDRFFSPRWLVVGDTLYKFKIPQIFLTGHCDTVHLSVIHAQDIYECTMEDPVEGFFVLDFQPPLVYFDDPECGESITDPLQPFRIQIIEEPCGIIDPNSFIVNINGVEHDIFDGIWDPDIFMFTIIPEDSLVSGDTNSVCITAASDSAEYCGPNTLSSPVCCDFFVDYEFPQVTILVPEEDGMVTSCEDQGVVILFQDLSGVDWSTVDIMVDGVHYNCDSPEGTCRGDTFFFNPPPGIYDDCEWIDFAVVSAADVLGNAITGVTIVRSFLTDFSGPYVFLDIDSPVPVPGGPPVSPIGLTAQVALVDECSEVDPMTIRVQVCNLNSGICDTFTVADPALSWFGSGPADPGWIYLEFVYAPGFIMNDQDTIEICVLNAGDNATSCLPNAMEEPYCWRFYIDALGPQADMIYPLEGQVTTCNCQNLKILLEDPAGVNEGTIELEVDGTVYSMLDGELFFVDGPLIDTLFFICGPSTPRNTEACDTILVRLLSAIDSLGNNIPDIYSWQFIMDHEGPYIEDFSPVCGSADTSGSPQIRIAIRDDCGYTCPTETELVIELVKIDPPSTFIDTLYWGTPGLNWATGNPGTLLVDIGSVPGMPRFEDLDTIFFCLLDIADSADIVDCYFNHLEDSACCWFNRSSAGPTANLLDPAAGACISCEDICILLEVYDRDGVDASTIVFEFEGEIFTIASSELSYDPETETLRFCPSRDFSVCDEVEFCLLEANDMLGTPMASRFCRDFRVDLRPPAYSNPRPTPGIILESTIPMIRINVQDTCCGVRMSSLCFTITTPSWTDTYCASDVDDSSVYWVGDVATWNPVLATPPRSFNGGDSVEICMQVTDATNPLWCPSNLTEYCWHFFIASGAPVAYPIFPTPGLITACPSVEQIIISVRDTNGVVPESLILAIYSDCLTDTFHFPDATLSFDNDTLRFTPPIPLDGACECTVTVKLLQTADVLNNLGSMSPFSFVIDHSAPEIMTAIPCDEIISTISPVLGWTVQDRCSSVDDNSFWVTIEKDMVVDTFRIWTADYIYFDWRPSENQLFFSSWDDSLGGADSLYYCLYVSDLVDTCDANEADTCCWIRIAGGGPVVSLLAPAESLHYGESCLPLQFNFVVFDSNGVDAPSIEILVTYCGSVDTSFVYSDPEVVFSAGSLLTFTPNLPFCDCDTILIVIDQAYDVLGNPVQLNMFSFIIDLQPPVVTQLEPYYSPSSVDSVNNQAPEIRWLIQDACAGIDSFCPEAHAFNTSRTSESFFNWDDGVFSWEGDTLVLSLIRGAFILSRDDTLHVCLTNMCDNTDSCSNPIVYDSVSFCWWWIIAQGGPICMLDSAYSNLQEICNDDCIRFIIHDDDGVDTTTVEVTVNDIPYRIGDPGIAWRQPDTVIVCPTPLWNTEIVTIGASAAEDTVGLAMASPCEWTFYVDLNGPVGNYLGPWVMPYQPVCSLFIWDYDHPDSGYPMNPVDSTTIVVSVNGMLYYVDGARDSVIPSDTDTLVYIRSESLLVYNAVAAGDTFIAGDSITICIDSAYDFTGCIPANFLEDTYCWTFTINIGDGPRAFLEFPEYAGATIACDTLFYITLRVYDPDYILVDSTKIRVASPGMDTVFVWGDPQIEFISDIAGTLFTVYVDPTLFLLADDDYLIVEVVKLLDGLGNPYAPPLSVRFYIDYASPFLNSSYPTEMQVIPEPDPVIWLELLDDSSSVNCSTTIISINGDTIAWGDSNMWWNDDTLYYNTGESFEFRGGDTIEFCLIDIADIPYLCSPNHLPADTCWYFIIGTGGPFAEIIRPDSNSVTACSLQQVIVTITDTIPGGIRESTIVMVIDGETINYGDPRFTWIPAGTLYYDPVEPFSNGDTICVQLVSAMDSAFNPLENPLDWCFVVDLTPPLADTYSPLPDTAILNWEQEVCLRIYDEVSTLNDTLFYFTVYGNLYTLDSAALSWDSASSVLCFDPLLADTAWTEFETIDIEVWACDMATYCPPNCTTFSWSFTIGDDDTLPPDCAFFPCTTYAESTFIITVVFDDTSGIFDDDTDTTGQGIFLIYDLDGTVDFATGDYAQIMQMELQADGVTAISGPLGGFAETDTFVYMIRVCDNDFDFSNSRDRSCTFCGPGSCTIVNNEPPQWMIISPEDESYYSCCPPEVQEIIVWIYDPNGIRESSCTLMVNDSVYVSGVDADLSYDRVSNYLIFNPGEPWMNGDTLCCLLYGVEDNFGNALRDTLNWCFIVDCSSPVVFQVTPPESAFVLLEEIEDVRIHMEDSLCGIERDSLIFRVVVGEEQWEFIGLNPLYFERDTLVFPLPMSGVVYDRGDTLEFTLLQLCDCAEGCGANCISDSVYWWVFIKPITDCSVNPNPFTPNGDGYNDETSFDYPKRFDRDAEIEIYDIKGIHIRTLKPDHFRYIWDGTDKNGRDCRQGTYVYVVKAEGKEVCSGTVILAR